METNSSNELSFKKFICSEILEENAREAIETFRTRDRGYRLIDGLNLKEIDVSLFPEQKSIREVLSELYEEDNLHLFYLVASSIQREELEIEYIASGNHAKETNEYYDPDFAYNYLYDYFIYILRTKHKFALFEKSMNDSSDSHMDVFDIRIKSEKESLSNLLQEYIGIDKKNIMNFISDF